MAPDHPPKAATARPTAGPVWNQPVKSTRQRPTREAFVTAAVGLADAEGLNAVSVRRVATMLHSRPMSLYDFMAGRDDLIDLMSDAVMAEALVDELPDQWRDAIAALANGVHEVRLAHPWLVIASDQRPQFGPNSMRWLNQSLEALSPLQINRATKLAIVRSVRSYALNHVQFRWARWHEHLYDSDWLASAQTYLLRLVSTGDYQYLAAFGTHDLLMNTHEEPTFETGLNWLLTGIAADVESVSASSAPTLRPS
jgi:hypothetical protein